jgi:DNA topoisomerase-2
VEVNLTLKLLQPVKDIEKTLKLSVTLNTNNMNLFNADEQLRKYTIPMILDEFYGIRLCLYEKRKAYQLKQLNDTLRKITNKVMYIRSILEDKLDLRRKKLEEIVQALKTLKIEEHEGSYHYLIKMPMDSVTEEKVTELEKEHDTLQKQIQELTKTSIQTLWERELNVLKKSL